MGGGWPPLIFLALLGLTQRCQDHVEAFISVAGTMLVGLFPFDVQEPVDRIVRNRV